MAMSQHENLKRSLTARLHELQTRVAGIEADICAPEDADLSEQAVLDEDDEQLGALDEAGLAEIAAIKATLARIEHRRYGICTKCGRAIHAGRLEALLTAALCIECAEDDDRLHHRL
jgi:DnaK suppressor protein